MGKTQTCKRNSRRSLGRIDQLGTGVSGSFPLVKNKKRRIIVLQTVTLLYGVFLLAREYFIRIGVKTMKK